MSAARNALLRQLGALAVTGQAATYVPGQLCPCCGHGGWNVGRETVECARCGGALKLAAGNRR